MFEEVIYNLCVEHSEKVIKIYLLFDRNLLSSWVYGVALNNIGIKI